ncbi:MAG TPA: serine/threonine-protein kinase [Streptosporangiaceae bacterium]|nr:serine/threonine-protein kinase [Streptosporangiaceae bacterium]
MSDAVFPPGGLSWLPAGSLIGGYRLEDRIGQGGMAVVFRAHDTGLNRIVALKLLAPALAEDMTFRRRFARESLAAAAVDDPHIIPVYKAGEVDGVLFIAMRYVGGGDVSSLLHRDGPLPLARAAAIISAVASALDAAHAAGLVHRDVKPANMLLDVQPGRPDHVYLSDFGLSKALMGTSGLTGTGQFLGTLDYMSPEQFEGRPVDGRTDQYALACAAYELLTGIPPFRRDQGLAVAFAHLSAPPPPVMSRRPGLGPQVDDVFARALAKSPSDRFDTCGHFSEALLAALGQAPYDAGPAAAPAADPTGGPAQRAPTQVTERPAPAPAPDPALFYAAKPEPVQPAQVLNPAQAGGRRPGRRTLVIAAAVILVAGTAITAKIISQPAAQSTAYVASAGTGTVTPIDVATGHAGTPIRVGDGADAIAITPDGKTAFVANYGSNGSGNTVIPIDVATGHAGSPIRVGNGPDAIAITPDGRTAYVANYGNQDGNGDTMTPIDVATGRAGTPIKVGNGPWAIAITPDGKTAFVANYGANNGNTVTPIDVTTGRAGTPIRVGDGPDGIAITPDGETVYVASHGSSGSGTVTPVDVATGRTGTPIKVGAGPWGIAITPDGKTAYVANYGTSGGGHTVTPIDAATGHAGAPIQVGKGPVAIAITPDGKTAYVTNYGGGTVTPIDVATGHPGAPIKVGNSPLAVAMTP